MAGLQWAAIWNLLSQCSHGKNRPGFRLGAVFFIMMVTSLGGRFHNAATDIEPVFGFGIEGGAILEVAAKAVPYVFAMTFVVFIMAFIP